MFPAFVTVVVNVSPFPNSEDLKAPLSACASCWTSSSLTQQTLSPTFAFSVCGLNWMLRMWMTTAPDGHGLFDAGVSEEPPPPDPELELELDPPQAASPRTSRTARRGARR